jgi:hypothetical protein
VTPQEFFMRESAGQAEKSLASVNSAGQNHQLSQTELRFFHTFGYLLLSGRFSEDIGETGNAFDQVMAAPDNSSVPLAYSDGGRSMVPCMLDQHPTLNALK